MWNQTEVPDSVKNSLANQSTLIYTAHRQIMNIVLNDTQLYDMVSRNWIMEILL